MKPTFRYLAAAAAFACLTAALVVMDRESGRIRHERTCSGVEVEILDKDKMDFVTPEDVTAILDKEYGTYKGQRVDSVDLQKMEEILNGRSAIKKSEAYISRDGTVHIAITQREPIVLLITSDGKAFYADETGFMFPVQKKFQGTIPEISGSIPIDGAGTFKGEPKTEKERRWLKDITALVKYMESSERWAESISKVSVGEEGNLVMTPREGNETFMFGKPDGYRDKFRRMEMYYDYIAPTRDPSSKDRKPYKSVSVRYDGQIICK